MRVLAADDLIAQVHPALMNRHLHEAGANLVDIVAGSLAQQPPCLYT